MGESQKKILEMLAQGKINVEDAHRLLSAVGAEEGGIPGTSMPVRTTSARWRTK